MEQGLLQGSGIVVILQLHENENFIFEKLTDTHCNLLRTDVLIRTKDNYFNKIGLVGDIDG